MAKKILELNETARKVEVEILTNGKLFLSLFESGRYQGATALDREEARKLADSLMSFVLGHQ